MSEENKVSTGSLVPLPTELAEHLKLGWFTVREDVNGRAKFPTRFINETTLEVVNLLRSASGAEDCAANLASVLAAMDEKMRPGDSPEAMERAKRILLTEVLFTVLGYPAEDYPPKAE